MRRTFAALLVGLCVLGAWPTSARAATSGDDRREAIERLRKTAATSVAVRRDPVTGAVRSLRFGPGGLPGYDLATFDPASAASSFIDDHAALFGLKHGVGDLGVVAVWTDALGATHVELEQHHQGVPVFGARMGVHFDPAGKLDTVLGAVVPDVGVSTVATLRAADARDVAVHATGGSASAAVSLRVAHPGLWRGFGGRAHLVYVVDVDSTMRGRERVFVDAHDGSVVERFSVDPTALSRVAYDGGYGANYQVWQESDGPYAGGDIDVAHVIEYSEDAYELFAAISAGAYLSYDSDDATLEAVASAQIPCPNANWNGTSTNYCDGVTSDDIVGHEWAHAYTEYTHGLIYAWQPGAMNEGYSDIFGETVDLLNGAGTDTPGGPRPDEACSGDGDSVRWLIGEDANAFGQPLRDMWTPTCRGDPGRVNDEDFWCAQQDSGGVHTNSGVVNHTFALLVDGGTYNGQTVQAIGLTKAVHVYWRAMTVYQMPASGFADHADALEQSCIDLRDAAVNLSDLQTGAPSGQMLGFGDCVAVSTAAAATELTSPIPCEDTPLLQPDAPALCPDDQVVAPDFLADFESDPNDWTLSNEGVSDTYQPRDWEWTGMLPDGRAGKAFFALDDVMLGNCGSDNQAGVMYLESPDIVLSPTELPVLVFDHWVATEPGFDGGNVWLSVGGEPFVRIPGDAFTFNPYNRTLVDAPQNDNPMAGQPAFSGSDTGQIDGSWARSIVDLSGLAQVGDTVRLRFDFGVDGCNGMIGWYVDDVALVRCGECDTGADCDDGDACTANLCDDEANTCYFEIADSDGDGTIDCEDPCPFDPLDDADADGVCADLDNCPDDPNDDQADADGDGIGDACDPIDDGGSTTDTGGDTTGGGTTSPTTMDTLGNGTSDAGTGSDTGEPGQTSGGDGCGCRSDPHHDIAIMAAGLLLLCTRRRRSSFDVA